MKKNNKGFTLVELLAVIVLLGLLIAVAVPSVIGISNRIKRNMFCTKIEILESNAKMWGQDNLANKSATATVTVEELVTSGYVKNDDLENGKVLDPRTQEDLNSATLEVYYKNNRVVAKYTFKAEDASTCK